VPPLQFLVTINPRADEFPAVGGLVYTRTLAHLADERASVRLCSMALLLDGWQAR